MENMRTIDDALVKEIRKTTDELVARIPENANGVYYDVKKFSESIIHVYLTDKELPDEYFKGYLNEVKKMTPEGLKEAEIWSIEQGAVLYTLPETYKKRMESKAAQKRQD